MNDSRYFYRDLVPLEPFSEALQTRLHVPLPEDWWIVIADVAESTKAIEAGNYKKVNTVGAACIAAMINVNREIEIPFAFGGDGATFAIPDNLVKQVILALRGTQKLSRERFGLNLRVGLVKVQELIGQSLCVNVGKVRLSNYMTYTTFSGRGWEEAERRVKMPSASGVVTIHESDGPAEANFEGFECRWQGVPNFNGHKLSLLIAAMTQDTDINQKIYQEVYEKIHAIYGDVTDYHPLRSDQMRLTLNPKLLSHEWRVRSSQYSAPGKLGYFIKLLFLGLAGKIFSLAI